MKCFNVIYFSTPSLLVELNRKNKIINKLPLLVHTQKGGDVMQ